MFENKIVAITGGANGIGKCIAGGEHFVGDISDKAVLEAFADNVIKE